MSSPRPAARSNNENGDIELVDILPFVEEVKLSLRKYIEDASFHKVAGKSRAKAYLKGIESITDEQALIRRIYWDLQQTSGKGRLDTSKVLREILETLLAKVELTDAVTAKKTFKEMLDECLDCYLLTATSPFKNQGRSRANQYKQERVLNDHSTVDDELALAVYMDISAPQGHGLLDTSEDLRGIFSNLLCEYKNLHVKLKSRAEARIRDMVKSMSYGPGYGGGHIPSLSYFMAAELPQLLKETFGSQIQNLASRPVNQRG